MRKALSPLVRIAFPLATETKLVTVSRGKLSFFLVIFAASHGFKEDSVDTLLLADRMAYMLIGSLPQIFKSVEGSLDWVADIIRDEAFDISQYDRQEGIAILRGKLATLWYELMAKYSRCRHSRMPYGKVTEIYWKQFIDDLMAEVKFYDYEVEKHTKYCSKDIINQK